MQPFGVQATKRGAPAHRWPRFVGCSPSTSLSTLMVSMTRFCEICFGTGNCTRMPSTRASALSSRTSAEQRLFRGVGGELVIERGDARFGGRLGLVAHVDLRRRVLTDEDDGQSRLHALGLERVGLGLDLGAHPRRDRFAVDDFRAMTSLTTRGPTGHASTPISRSLRSLILSSSSRFWFRFWFRSSLRTWFRPSSPASSTTSRNPCTNRRP